jgi:hypothetical protein
LPLGTKNDNFHHYLKKNHFTGSAKNEIAKAVKGIGGMMKFSNHNSPVLLEALGEVLSNADNGDDPGAGHLSSRAYLKAALLSNDSTVSEAYKKKAKSEIERNFMSEQYRRTGSEGAIELEHAVIGLKDLEKVLKLEIQAAMYYDEPSSKDINQYNARKNENQIEEDYWLSVQLENASSINSMYTILDLPDATKKWVDNIYQLEFSMLPDNSETTISNPSKNAPKKNSGGIPVWIYPLGIAVLLVAIFIGRILLGRRK